MVPRAARPRRGDMLVAAGCWVLSVALLAALPVISDLDPEAAVDVTARFGGAAWWWLALVLTVQAAALLGRRRWPELVAGAVALAVPLAAAGGAGVLIGLTSPAVLVALYTLGTLRAPARVWPVLAGAGVLVGAGHVAAGWGEGVPAAVAAGLVQTAFLVGAPLAVAVVVVTRRESRVAREERLAALEREQGALVQAAVARERTAMARELHDIAAHHLTGIAVMSAAIATQIDTDPGAAKAAVGEVRRQSTAVLRDLRNLVGLLREHDDTRSAGGTGAAGAAPAGGGVRTETVAGIPGLVAAVAAAGQDVGVTVLGPVGDRSPAAGIGPLAQLAAYRTVQEALANAGRHAPGARAEVEVDDRDGGSFVVTVRNARAPRAPDPAVRGGLGLVGMRERAELTGSRLETGATAAGGWQVRLRVPRAEPAGEAP